MASLAASFDKLPKQQQLAVLIAVPVLIAVAIAYFAWGDLGKLGPDQKLPKMFRRDVPGSIYQQIAGKNDSIAAQQKIIDDEPNVDKQLKDLAGEIKENRDRLPTEAEKSEMRQLIEKMARDLPAEIGKVQFLGVKIIESALPDRASRSPDGEYQTITYQTEVIGDLNGIIKYIDTIEKNTRFMQVRSLSLRPGGIRQAQSLDHIDYELHSASMEIVTYVWIPPNKGHG